MIEIQKSLSHQQLLKREEEVDVELKNVELRNMSPANKPRRLSHQSLLSHRSRLQLEPEECAKSVVSHHSHTSRDSVPKLPNIGDNLPALTLSESQKLLRKLRQDNCSTASTMRPLKPEIVPQAKQWLLSADDNEKRVVSEMLRSADRATVQKTIEKTLQPQAAGAVQDWMQGADESERQVVMKFFDSLAHSQRPTMDLENSDAYDGADVMGILRRRRLRILSPATRRNKEMYKTWHHYSELNPGPSGNTIPMFTTPKYPARRHFVIHPEWSP